MKLSQLTESFVISNDEFEDYLNRATEQLVSELSSGKNPRDAVHDLALTFADQHNKSYDAYQRMADSLGARMHTLEMNSPTDMMNGPKDDMGMGSVDEPEMMSDPMGNMEMNTPASSEMPSDSDMEDYAAVMDNEQEVEESYSPDDEVKEAGGSDKVIFRKFPEGDVIALFPEQDEDRGTINSYMTVGQHSEASKSLIDELEPASPEEYADLMSELKKIGYNPIINEAPFSKSEGSDEEKTRRRALDLADEPERGEERKKVSLKKAPWEESVDEDIKDTVKAAGKKIGKATKKAKKFFGHGEHAAFDEFDDDEFDESVSESAIDTIRKIADEKSAMKIKFDNGTMMVDMFTASAVKSVYDNVNDANKEKLDNLMKTKEGMMKVANLSMKMLKEGRLDEIFPFIGAAISGLTGAARAAGAVAGAARAAGGLGKAAKVARTASGVATMANIAKGVGNAYSDPTYKRATGKHLEHTDWRLEMKADDIMNSAIDKVNKK
jgi:hypothetical protein